MYLTFDYYGVASAQNILRFKYYKLFIIVFYGY